MLPPAWPRQPRPGSAGRAGVGLAPAAARGAGRAMNSRVCSGAWWTWPGRSGRGRPARACRRTLWMAAAAGRTAPMGSGPLSVRGRRRGAAPDTSRFHELSLVFVPGPRRTGWRAPAICAGSRSTSPGGCARGLWLWVLADAAAGLACHIHLRCARGMTRRCQLPGRLIAEGQRGTPSAASALRAGQGSISPAG